MHLSKTLHSTAKQHCEVGLDAFWAIPDGHVDGAPGGCCVEIVQHLESLNPAMQCSALQCSATLAQQLLQEA